VAAAAGGIVAISGAVFSIEDQRRAEAAARSVNGVVKVVNTLTVV
jgi:osmotically-inducible protein OsmY